MLFRAAVKLPLVVRIARGRCGGPQPLAGGQVAGLLFRDPDLNPYFSHDHVFHQMVSASERSPAPLDNSRPLTHAPLTFPTRSLGRTIAACEGALPTVPERRRTAGSGPAAAVPTLSVYHSLSIVPVGVVTPPGGHGPPASGLPAPRRRAHRAPPGHRRAPGGLPARGGGSRRRRGPAAVRRARVPGVPDVRRVRTRCGAIPVRGLRASIWCRFRVKGGRGVPVAVVAA